jgi:hypothetical protein
LNVNRLKQKTPGFPRVSLLASNVKPTNRVTIYYTVAGVITLKIKELQAVAPETSLLITLK